MKQYLEAGKIINTHGVLGEVKIESWCDTPDILTSLGTLYIKKADGSFSPLRVTHASVHKNMALVKIDGTDNVEGALRYKNIIVYALRDNLPLKEGSHFVADLLGLPVTDADSGTVYGRLTAVTDNGANEVYEITRKDGTKAYIPAINEFVCEIDLEKGIFIRPIEGMLD